MKLPGRLHFNLPVTCYGEHKKPGFLERLQTRMVELPGRTEILRQNLGKVEECRALFGAKVEELIAKIRAEAQTIQQELATLREKLERDISTAVQEVEATMHADEALHISPLGQLLRDTSVPAEQLCRFDYQAEADFVWPLRSCFSFRLLDGQAPLNTLSAVFGSQLQVYDLTTKQVVKTHTLTRTFTPATVFCTVDSARMLCIGAYPATKEVYWVNMSESCLITAAAELLTARGYAGVVLVKKCVLVFGGNNPQISASEKYTTLSNTWTALPPMTQPRHAFNPCAHLNDIYLAELRQYKGAEKFSLLTETYTQLTVALTSSAGHSMSVLVGKEILFLSYEKKLYKWHLETGAVTSADFAVNSPPTHYLSSNPPIYTRDKAYFVHYNTGQLLTFNLTSSTLS